MRIAGKFSDRRYRAEHMQPSTQTLAGKQNKFILFWAWRKHNRTNK